ncbi:MAG: hypothetical protein WC150_14475 [Bacteroidia bacterium]
MKIIVNAEGYKKYLLLLGIIWSVNARAQLIDYSSIDTNIQSIYEWRVSYKDSGRIDTSLETILFYDSTGYLTEKRWNFRSHMKGDYTSMKYERMNLGSQEIITFSNPPPLFDGHRVDLVRQSCDHFDSHSRLIKVEKNIKPDIHQLTTFSYEKSGLLKEVIVIENDKVRFKYFVEYKYR